MTTPPSLEDDPLHGTPEVREYFGAGFERVDAFARMLADQGVARGLIGPREVERLWERHLLNSAALQPFLPAGVVADVGSGAGLPGLVLAAMDPDRELILVEPMERRVQWLREASRTCGIDNVRIVRGRAEELSGAVEADVVTARAVAAVEKLVKWTMPLLRPGGRLVLLKGRSAADELERARYTLRRYRLTAEVHEAGTVVGVDPTTVVVLQRD